MARQADKGLVKRKIEVGREGERTGWIAEQKDAGEGGQSNAASDSECSVRTLKRKMESRSGQSGESI